ncbi:rRNA pseudouridine synthase [Candidatus Saccharibacteria bacterium]|nr:rRNA pseudouridine synthase [Candidatus Saccharibacteria bacterium]
MRINKYLAQATGISRRAADRVLLQGKVTVNGIPAATGVDVGATDTVLLNGRELQLPASFTTIMLNKPAGYICSRDGQGGKTIYDLLPKELHTLKPVGRLDKDTSGLLLLTDDGKRAQELTHPKYQKEKRYEVKLHKPLTEADFVSITTTGVTVEDGVSTLGLESLDAHKTRWKVTMHEGRNRQIRRTFEALGYRIVSLHRTHFGPYSLNKLTSGTYAVVEPDK